MSSRLRKQTVHSDALKDVNVNGVCQVSCANRMFTVTCQKLTPNTCSEHLKGSMRNVLLSHFVVCIDQQGEADASMSINALQWSGAQIDACM